MKIRVKTNDVGYLEECRKMFPEYKGHIVGTHVGNIPNLSDVDKKELVDNFIKMVEGGVLSELSINEINMVLANYGDVIDYGVTLYDGVFLGYTHRRNSIDYNFVLGFKDIDEMRNTLIDFYVIDIHDVLYESSYHYGESSSSRIYILGKDYDENRDNCNDGVGDEYHW